MDRARARNGTTAHKTHSESFFETAYTFETGAHLRADIGRKTGGLRKCVQGCATTARNPKSNLVALRILVSHALS